MKTTKHIAECPYCGHKNKYAVHDAKEHRSKKIVYCNLDEGGCNNEFVLDYWVVPKSKARAIADLVAP